LISLPVDSIEDVVTLDNHRRANPPENLHLSLRDACAAAWDLGNQLLLELDPERLIRQRDSENT
jgi:chemotaxis signal transduction protein